MMAMEAISSSRMSVHLLNCFPQRNEEEKPHQLAGTEAPCDVNDNNQGLPFSSSTTPARRRGFQLLKRSAKRGPINHASPITDRNASQQARPYISSLFSLVHVSVCAHS